MASIYGEYVNYTRLRIDYDLSQNIANNTTTISMRLYAERTKGSAQYNSSGTAFWNLSGTGNNYANFNWAASSLELYLGSSSVVIVHNNDGTAGALVSGYWYTGRTGSSYIPTELSVSGGIDIPTIPRASVPSCITFPNTTQHIGNLGDTITIFMNRASGNFTHNVYCVWGNKTITVGMGVADQVAFTIPKDFADNVPNTDSGIGAIWVDTFSGGTMIGTKTVTFTASVPNTDEFRPSISKLELSETIESIYEQFGAYIQNQSRLHYTVTANGAYSSSIKTYKVVVNGATYNTKTDITDVLKLSGTNSIVVTVTDSRGRTDEVTDTFEVLAYAGPTITKFIANRCTEDGTLDDEGDFAKIEITATIPNLNDKNEYSYYFQYRDTDNDEFTLQDIELTEIKTETEITLSGNFVVEANGDDSFDYMFTLQDYFIPRNKLTGIDTVFQLMNWNANGRGMAIGKVSEKDALEIAMDMYDKFGQLINNGIAEQGTIDADTTLSHLCITNINTPEDSLCYVMTMFNAEKTETTNRSQIAMQYIEDITARQDRNMYSRHCVNGTWSDWVKVGNENCYSTEEQVIGKWISGKPLYRKVLVFPNGVETVTTNEGIVYPLSNFGINDVDDIYIGSPSFYTHLSYRIPFNYYDGNEYQVQASSSELLIVCTYDGIANRRMLITLEYTKTTD